MKRTVVILIGVLVGVCVALSIIARDDEYAAEKLFYRATRLSRKIITNPEVAPDAVVKPVESSLLGLLRRYPKTNIAKKVDITLAKFYIFAKKYDKALATLDAIINKSSPQGEAALLSAAQFLKGVVYERQGLWDEALKEFLILRDRYTYTQLGMQVPIYIGRHYDGQGMELSAKKAYEDALIFYRRLERRHRKRTLGYVASEYLVEAYAGLKRYEEAGRAIEDIIDRYPSEMAYRRNLAAVELVFIKMLKKPEKAVEIYAVIKGKTKDAGLKRLLEKRIINLRTGK